MISLAKSVLAVVASLNGHPDLILVHVTSSYGAFGKIMSTVGIQEASKN